MWDMLTSVWYISYTECSHKVREFIAIVFNFALVYAIRKVRVNWRWLKPNGLHQLPVYADDIK
jgi:hypothetical protein